MKKLYREIGKIEPMESGDAENRHITGYAIVFNSESEDLGFIEVIDRSAVTQELIDRSDVYATLNHDMDKVLARSNKGQGSLTLTLDDTGLRYEFDAPHTDLGDTLLEYIKRGDLSKSSFAFAIDESDPDAQIWERRDDGKIYRVIYKIAALFDVASVFTPAYEGTSVENRSREEYNAIIEREAAYDKMIEEIEALKI